MRDALSHALHYLSFQDRCYREVVTYLEGKGCEEQEIETAIASLQGMGYLNDEDYCRRFIQLGIQKMRGPLRLERELKEKGLELTLIKLCLESEYDRNTERQTALALAQKTNETEGRRLARRLAYQGFGTSVIYETLKKLPVDIEDETL